MAQFKFILVWPATGRPDRLWLSLADEEDLEVDAFARTARAISELYSEGLSALGLQGRCSELRFFVVHDPSATEVQVRVLTERPEGFESARAKLPTGVATLPAGERQQLVLEVVHGAVLRLAQARGWEPEELDAARQHVVRAGFEFRWEGPWKTSPDRRHRARARYRLTEVGWGRAWIEVADRDQVVVAESGDALAYCTHAGFKRSALTLRWDGSAAVHLIPYSGHIRRDAHGLVRLEHREAGWVSFVEDGMNADTFAATASANPPVTGSGMRPAVEVRADGAHEEESPTRIRFIGGGPTNDVPDAYLKELHRLLSAFAGPEGQDWWLGAGVKELQVTYFLEAERPRVRTRLYRNVLSAEIQRSGLGLDLVADPVGIAVGDVENLVTAVRKRAGLGPHPILPG